MSRIIRFRTDKKCPICGLGLLYHEDKDFAYLICEACGVAAAMEIPAAARRFVRYRSRLLLWREFMDRLYSMYLDAAKLAKSRTR